MKRLIPALVLILGAVSIASAADIINGCYKKTNGQFRILIPPKTCLKSETAVSLPVGGGAGNPNPLVYDANDQFLGVGQAGDIYIPSLRMWATINLRDVSGDIWSGQLYYQNSDCTGQPYAEYEYLHRVFGVGQAGNRKYYTAAPELEGYVRIGSFSDGWDDGTGNSGTCQAIDYDLQVVMSKAVPVELPFTVPVALPTKVVNP